MKFDIDLMRITIKEYRLLFDDNTSQDDEDTVIAKAANMKLEELQNLPIPVYRQLLKAFLEKAQEKPEESGDSPNSVGGSTSA